MDDDHITAREYTEIMLAALAQQEAIGRLSRALAPTDRVGLNIMAERAHRVPQLDEEGQ